ncbi:7925_t:CDS:1, partial [Dentiscutata heterogama]
AQHSLRNDFIRKIYQKYGLKAIKPIESSMEVQLYTVFKSVKHSLFNVVNIK